MLEPASCSCDRRCLSARFSARQVFRITSTLNNLSATWPVCLKMQLYHSLFLRCLQNAFVRICVFLRHRGCFSFPKDTDDDSHRLAFIRQLIHLILGLKQISEGKWSNVLAHLFYRWSSDKFRIKWFWTLFALKCLIGNNEEPMFSWSPISGTDRLRVGVL